MSVGRDGVTLPSRFPSFSLHGDHEEVITSAQDGGDLIDTVALSHESHLVGRVK